MHVTISGDQSLPALQIVNLLNGLYFVESGLVLEKISISLMVSARQYIHTWRISGAVINAKCSHLSAQPTFH